MDAAEYTAKYPRAARHRDPGKYFAEYLLPVDPAEPSIRPISSRGGLLVCPPEQLASLVLLNFLNFCIVLGCE